MQLCHPTPSRPPRCRAIHRGAFARSLLGAALVTVVTLGTLVALPAPAAAQLAVTAVDPDGALPAEPVVVSGSGFGQDPDALLCWVDTGSGGFPFEVTAAADGHIDALLGAVPMAATGTVTVWQGERYALADRVVLSQGRLFAASDGELFVRRSAAAGPTFSAFAGSSATFGAVRAQGELRLDLQPVDPGGAVQEVRVTAVIETSDDSGNSTPQGNLVFPLPSGALTTADKTGGPAWATSLTIGADAPPPTADALAAGLAEVLEAQLGSVGLTARAEGSVLVVSHAQGIRAGFLELTSP